MMNVSPEMSNSDWLNLAESRLSVMTMFNPLNITETSRLKDAIKDIQSRMTLAQLEQHAAKNNTQLSVKDLEAKHEQIVKLMNENRDKPSV